LEKHKFLWRGNRGNAAQQTNISHIPRLTNDPIDFNFDVYFEIPVIVRLHRRLRLV